MRSSRQPSWRPGGSQGTSNPGGVLNSNQETAQSFKKHCPATVASLTLAVPVCLTILASGSAGNCAYLETDHARLLIDAGLSLRQIRKRLATIGRAPEKLTAILVTHEHSDHVQGLA